MTDAEYRHLLADLAAIEDLNRALSGGHGGRHERLGQWVADSLRRLHRTKPKRERPRCGARCRDGHPCSAPVTWDRAKDRARNGRCRMHGGLSTGPRTVEGRARIAEYQRERWRRWREKRGRDRPVESEPSEPDTKSLPFSGVAQSALPNDSETPSDSDDFTSENTG